MLQAAGYRKTMLTRRGNSRCVHRHVGVAIHHIGTQQATVSEQDISVSNIMFHVVQVRANLFQNIIYSFEHHIKF